MSGSEEVPGEPPLPTFTPSPDTVKRDPNDEHVRDDPIVKWEPPPPDPDEANPELPAFHVRARNRAPKVTEGGEVVEDRRGSVQWEPEHSWQPFQERPPEPPPPAPKQFWAGWLPDPRHRHHHRYWDGSAWTDNVADDGVASIDPV